LLIAWRTLCLRTTIGASAELGIGAPIL